MQSTKYALQSHCEFQTKLKGHKAFICSQSGYCYFNKFPALNNYNIKSIERSVNLLQKQYYNYHNHHIQVHSGITQSIAQHQAKSYEY